MAAIFIDNQRLVQQFGQPIGLLGIVVDQLDIDLVLQFGRNAYADARTAEDHHVVDLHVGMPRELHHLLHGILPGDDIHHVALHKYFILPGDDGLTAASDRHRPIAELRRIVLETRKFASDEGRGRIKTENHERKPSAREIDVLRRRSVPQQIDHLLSRHLFRIEQVVDTHVDKNLLVIGLQVFVVVDPGDGFLGPELLGQHRCHHVVVLDMIDGDEQVALSHRSLPQHGKGRGVALDRQHVGLATSASSFGSLSMTVMSCPLPLSIFARWLPISPAPAITIFIPDLLCQHTPGSFRAAFLQLITQMYKFASEHPNFHY